MGYGWLCAGMFIATYSLSLLYTSIFYHRGFTHRAFAFPQRTKQFIIRTGNWITGLDPKTWVCMHRLHHRYADTKKDPHSPTYVGVFPLMLAQLKSYEKTTHGLLTGRKSCTGLVKDLDFPVHWLNRSGYWYLPHALHFGIGLVMGFVFGAPLLGAAYFFGMMAHPFQGWMVNAFGHRFGYRNFKTPDRSTNHTLTAWLVWGEGYQNNHHHHAQKAKFSVKWWEFDFGYLVCLGLAQLGIIRFAKPRKLRPIKRSLPRKLSA